MEAQKHHPLVKVQSTHCFLPDRKSRHVPLLTQCPGHGLKPLAEVHLVATFFETFPALVSSWARNKRCKGHISCGEGGYVSLICSRGSWKTEKDGGAFWRLMEKSQAVPKILLRFLSCLFMRCTIMNFQCQKCWVIMIFIYQAH